MGKPVQINFDDETLSLLDEYANQVTDEGIGPNRSRAVRETVDLVDEARELTGEENPVEALQELLRAYPRDARQGEYDPDEYQGYLSSDDIEAMVKSDPVPDIDPEHVDSNDIPSKTTHKAGLVAGVLRHEFDATEMDDVEDEDAEKWMRRLVAARSAVDPSTVLWRLNRSVPYAARLDARDWTGMAQDYLHNTFLTGADHDVKREWISEHIRDGKELLEAAKRDGNEELEMEVEELLSGLQAEIEELEAEEAEDELDAQMEASTPGQCRARAKGAGDRCHRDAEPGEKYCRNHLNEIEQYGEDAVMDYESDGGSEAVESGDE
ncbi:hypothetical protein GS429_15850 [Natronorubrum sp. JWXQ-INN-674]|uniref:Uncharacterized protein n=1 Tax=Natronorubrum halalkaliphilum TaxID=2691917 RepID=A0A6B0VRU7_9EURY|nr:hypothetical protein [Natronorubrum halalkaliphilum]MXV63502.1 hypothetical protein [Natronorubrum halalkaliphilum]